MTLSPNWEFVADTVMGGVSTGQATRARIDGRDAMRLQGDVSLDNNGGFVQMAFDLEVDATTAKGLRFDVFGNGETYDIRLRTTDLTRPWQSFRAEFTAPPTWTTITIPFSEFTPNKTDHQFDPAKLRRIGFLAYGREFTADLAVANIALYD